MAFGIGINTQGTRAVVPKGRRMEVACDCWFTACGTAMPRMIKVRDESGEIQTIKEIKVNYVEEKNYGGIPSLEYDCLLTVRDRCVKVKLIYEKNTCKWGLIFE